MSSFSYPTGQPPTPTKTPTSATFPDPSFQTPKPESSFFDPRVTWNTADPYGSSPTALQTPQQPTFKTPNNHPSASSSHKRPLYNQDLDIELASHVHHLSPTPGLELPPVEPSRQLSSSPNPLSTKRTCLDGEQPAIAPPTFGPSLKASSKMQSAGAMQTPPPTSTSASKRKAQQAQVAKLVKESAMGGRTLSSPNFSQFELPEQNAELIQASPQLFPDLQFSPDVFGFSSAGPATAPIYPQQKLFWDPNTSMGTMDMDFTDVNHDPFGPHEPLNITSFMSTQPGSYSIAETSGFHTGSGPHGLLAQGHVSLPIAATTSAIQSSSRASRKARTSSRKVSANPKGHEAAVDPNLLFSSSDRLEHTPLKPGISGAEHVREIRQPYLHQMQELRREQELGRGRRAKSKQALDMPVAPREDKRPHPKRRSTDTAIRNGSIHMKKLSQVSFLESSAPVEKGFPPSMHSRSSPIKSRDTAASATKALKSHPRTSVTFTIDDKGRARTETKVAVDGSESETDVDIKTGVNGRWGTSDSETSEDAETAITTSFRSSFTFPTSKQPRLARFATDSISHSKKSSYSSTYESSRSEHSFAGPSLTPHLHSSSSYASNDYDLVGMRKSRGAGSLSSGTTSDISSIVPDGLESEAETVVESDVANGNAQHAIKKVLKDRAKKKRAGNNPGSTSESRMKQRDHVHSPSKCQTQASSRYPPPVTTPTQPQDHGGYGDGFNISPTTITDPDIATPSTGRASSAGDGTRCVCHSADNGGRLMIQW